MPYNVVPWDSRMCFDLALGIDATEDILVRYNVSHAEYEQWCKNPAFVQAIAEYQKYIRENGLSFRAKARVQAEDLLNVAYRLAHSSDVPPSVRADLIKWIAKMAELEPKQADPQIAERFTKQAVDKMLSSMSDGELEIQVMRVLNKKAKLIEGEFVKTDD